MAIALKRQNIRQNIPILLSLQNYDENLWYFKFRLFGYNKGPSLKHQRFATSVESKKYGLENYKNEC